MQSFVPTVSANRFLAQGALGHFPLAWSNEAPSIGQRHFQNGFGLKTATSEGQEPRGFTPVAVRTEQGSQSPELSPDTIAAGEQKSLPPIRLNEVAAAAAAAAVPFNGLGVAPGQLMSNGLAVVNPGNIEKIFHQSTVNLAELSQKYPGQVIINSMPNNFDMNNSVYNGPTQIIITKRPVSIPNETREALVKMVKVDKISIKRAAAKLRINYSSAKTIMYIYQKEGRIHKKRADYSLK